MLIEPDAENGCYLRDNSKDERLYYFDSAGGKVDAVMNVNGQDVKPTCQRKGDLKDKLGSKFTTNCTFKKITIKIDWLTTTACNEAEACSTGLKAHVVAKLGKETQSLDLSGTCGAD